MNIYLARSILIAQKRCTTVHGFFSDLAAAIFASTLQETVTKGFPLRKELHVMICMAHVCAPLATT
jgi:hypothetical protein